VERVVVWIPSGDPGWDLEEARPYDPPSVGGGIRTLYEVAAALVVAGRDVELRGVIAQRVLGEVCAAAGAWPKLPAHPRPPTANDTVIVPEGISDPEVHARLVLSPARTVLLMLGPLGLIGWPFADGWSPPDPLTVDVDAVARPEHFRAAAALGYELWTHTPGLQHAAEAAGVPCRFIGNGVPGGYPTPARKRDIDVGWLQENRWADLSRTVVDRLTALGIECAAIPAASQREVLDYFARTRVLLHPLRIEGHSRIGCEARAMGAVPAVLRSNPYAVGLDDAGGALAVDTLPELADAVAGLLAAPAALERLSAAGMRSARRQVDWGVFVSRVDAAYAAGREHHGRPARAAIGDTLRRRRGALQLELEARAAELERHRRWLEAINASLTWRVTAPLRGLKRRLVGERSRFEQPRGRIEWPPDGSERPRAPVDVHGWCVFPGSSVARVEVSLNGAPPIHARIGVEGPGQVDAPLCGFEYKPDLAAIPAGRPVARIAAVAHAMDGRTLELDPVVYPLSAPSALPREEAQPRSRPHMAARHGAATRVLAFTHTLGYGGASLYLLELLRRLRRDEGLEFEVIAMADGPLRRLLEDSGIPVHVTDGNAAGSLARWEGHLDELLGWARPRGFDAVLVNTLGSFAGADLAARLGIPAVWVVHESFTLPMFWFTAYPPACLDPRVRARAEQALRRASAVVFVAEATRRLFVADADPERLVSLPYGIEVGQIRAARDALDRSETRRRLGIDENAQVLLCLGSIEPRKAQAMLAQAFAQVADRHPDALLVLVGATEDGYSAGYRAALGEYIARAGLGARVRVEPVTSDPWSWHSVADLLVCASDTESLPRSVAEAMAFGTPVLSTRVFGVPELIQDGVDGFLCETRDVASLADGLDRVLGMDPDALAAVARAGSERVSTRHDPELYATRMRRLIEGAVADPDALPPDVLEAPPLSWRERTAAGPPASARGAPRP
jgi:glycosyltransferase involved in cell wall biosynthesis